LLSWRQSYFFYELDTARSKSRDSQHSISILISILRNWVFLLVWNFKIYMDWIKSCWIWFQNLLEQFCYCFQLQTSYFHIDKQYEEYRKKRNTQLKENGQELPKDIVFIPQTIGNACGTIGLYHALSNNKQDIDFGNGVFANYMNKINGQSGEEIARILETERALANIHDSS
jgi:hypothetical protein